MKYYTIYVYRKGYILNNHGDYSHSAMRAGRIKAFGNKKVTIQNAQIGQAKFLEEALIKNNRFIIETLKATVKI